MPRRTLFVGDVHGCADELHALLELAQAERVVLVGDLFTKGPDPVGVFELVREHEAVLGNHDARLLAAVEDRRSRDREALRCAQKLRGVPWKRWLRARPVITKVRGFKVVHGGLHPEHPRQTTRNQALNLRRYPARGQFWWQTYTGKRGVVFGHDATRGLVRVEREGRPWLIGLDTGCVYGGHLTGWLLDEDQYLQIPAKRVYKPIG